MLERKFYVFIIATLSPVLFFIHRNINSLSILNFWASDFVKCTAEDKLGILMVAYLGVMFLIKQCLLTYIYYNCILATSLCVPEFVDERRLIS
jgi:hypothetical protein